MSLILEALKKSEAERQRGKAPGLFVQQAPLASRRRRESPLRAVLAGLVVVAALAAGAWWLWRPMGGDPAPNGIAAEAPPTDQVVAPAALPPPPPAVPLPVEPSPAPSSSRPVPAAMAPPPATPPPSASTSPPAPVPMPAAAAKPAPGVPPVPAPAPQALPSAPTLPPPAAGPSLPTLSELSAAERNALPPLKASMHVYADEPGQRFVILDGRRHAEGAVVTEGLVVQEIRRDGVVLSLNGRALLLPRP